MDSKTPKSIVGLGRVGEGKVRLAVTVKYLHFTVNMIENTWVV